MVVGRILFCLMIVLMVTVTFSHSYVNASNKHTIVFHHNERLVTPPKNIPSNTINSSITKKTPKEIRASNPKNSSIVNKKISANTKNLSQKLPRQIVTQSNPSSHRTNHRELISKTIKSNQMSHGVSRNNAAISHLNQPSSSNRKNGRGAISREASFVDINRLSFSSRSVMVYDEAANRVLYSRNADEIVPIASITKLMTAMVILDANLPLHTPITITEEDVDTLRHSSSRLPVGAVLPRRELLRLSLMSSENRATHALARTYPGGVQACVAAMNRKAASLGMSNTFFADPTGLYATNRSTAHDLMKLVKHSYQYDLIQEFTTTAECKVASNKGCISFRNTNPLVREGRWDIELSKTGFINEAGLCLVMKANIADRPVIIVLLDADSKEGRLRDANNIKRWLEEDIHHPLTAGSVFRHSGRS